MQRSRFVFSLVIALFFSTLALANTVSMEFVSTGSNSANGYYTYPYYFSINGGAPTTALMCDTFMNHITYGETWTANVTPLLSGKGLFGNSPTALLDYKAAGIIFLDILSNSTSSATGNSAVWNLFDPSAPTNSAVAALEASALSQAKHESAAYFKGLVIYTPTNATVGSGPQEFIGYGNALATPEPGSLLLLSTGLVGIAGMVRRKLLRG